MIDWRRVDMLAEQILSRLPTYFTPLDMDGKTCLILKIRVNGLSRECLGPPGKAA